MKRSVKENLEMQHAHRLYRQLDASMSHWGMLDIHNQRIFIKHFGLKEALKFKRFDPHRCE